MAGTPKPIGRILIIPRGDYDLATPYNSLDLVRYDKKTWLCKTDGIIGITPTEGTDWTLMTEDGTDGRGIVDIQRTGTDPSNPLKDIYTITYTDGTTSTFTVTNGSGGGTTADTMLKSVYDTDDDGIVDKADTANTATNATDATNAKNLKKSNGTIVDADTITTKLSKVDTTDNLSVELSKKIDKPASATNGQVLTYNGTSNEWEAKNPSASITEPTDLEKGIIGGDAWASGKAYAVNDVCIYNNKVYACINVHTSSASILPTNTTYWKVISLKSLNENAGGSTQWQLLKTLSSMGADGQYDIPDITKYNEIGFIVYGTAGCSAMQIYPSAKLVELNGDAYTNTFNRPCVSVVQAGGTYVSVLMSILSSTKIRCEAVVVGGWQFVKLEMYGR